MNYGVSVSHFANGQVVKHRGDERCDTCDRKPRLSPSSVRFRWTVALASVVGAFVSSAFLVAFLVVALT